MVNKSTMNMAHYQIASKEEGGLEETRMKVTIVMQILLKKVCHIFRYEERQLILPNKEYSLKLLNGSTCFKFAGNEGIIFLMST